MASAPKEQKPGVMGWIEYRLPIFDTLKEALVTYPAPRNLNYFWNMGSIAGIMLVSQILTGFFLAMHYAANAGVAFDSVEHIMRDVNYGWLLRYMHAVGASMFFIVVYVHTFRGLYYGSYKAPRELLWWLGVIILLLMMATAFMGYVLPWGQMSFWGATVITNLFSAFPLVGESVVTWLWGGFAVDDPTLNRFYALHFILPFAIVGVVVLHLIALHAHGSNNPTGIDAKGPQDKIPFHPYYTAKDFFGFGVFFMVYAAMVFFAPNYLGDPANYIMADPMVTPTHIVPEWYFLPFYAILRSIVFDTALWLPGLAVMGIAFWWSWGHFVRRTFTPKRLLRATGLFGLGIVLVFSGLMGGMIPSKLAGVCAMFGSIIILFFIPWLDTSKVRSCNYRPLMRVFFWFFLADCIVLGAVGAHLPTWGTLIDWQADAPAIYKAMSWLPNVTVGLLATIYYFVYFLVLMPWIGKIEKPLKLPQSIGVPVTKHAH